MMPRQQAAVEFIATYSFAIFIISLMLVAATAISMALNSSTAPVYSTCNIQPLLNCQQSLLTYNSLGSYHYLTFVLVFRNNLGLVMQFPPNAINLTTAEVLASGKPSGAGSCSPTIADQGSQVVCITTLPGTTQLKQGANTYTQFSLHYSLCTSQSRSSCGSTLYSATGYSFQTLSPQQSSLYNFSISSPNGIVVINGQSYFDNSIVYLTGGSYLLYAQPNAGYTFNSWNGLLSSIANPSVPNTVLTANANGNVVAFFTHT